jgi:hypothetical protein
VFPFAVTLWIGLGEENQIWKKNQKQGFNPDPADHMPFLQIKRHRNGEGEHLAGLKIWAFTILGQLVL